MNWSIEFLPIFPDAVLIGLAVAAFLAAALSIWRNRRGAFLRILALAALLLALANPHIRSEERQPLSNIAVAVVDESSSQRIDHRAERAKAIEAQLKAKFAEIPNLEVRFARSRPAGPAGSETTNLFQTLGEALSDVPQNRVAGAIFITDGEIHDVPADLTHLGFDAPVHALLTGREGEKDNRIELVNAPRYGLVGSSQMVEFKAERSVKASEGGKLASFKIRRGGGRVETIQAPFGGVVRIPMRFEHAGQNILEIELETEPGELTQVNNRAIVQAEGVRENLRVLLVSGEPHAGERTWRNLLRSDAAVDLVHFTILRPPEKHDGTPIDQLSLIAFPTRELFSEKLNQFDLIIFDRYQRRGVLPMIYLDNVARYVENGGAVLVAAGADFASPVSLSRTPLGDILPVHPTGRVIEQPFRAKITAEGEKHPVTAGLPGAGEPGKTPAWGRWFRLVDSVPNGGEVLMSGAEDKPLLVLSRRGKGRIALLLSDHAWLWARGYDGGGPHVDLLRRTAHWLMKEPDLEEEALHATAGRNQLTVERRSVKDKIGEATVTSPSGQTAQVTLDHAGPGQWTKTIDAPEPGVYRVTMDGLTGLAVVGEMNAPEFKRAVTTTEPLAPVLEKTGGGAFFLGKADGGIKPLPRLAMMKSGHRFHGGSWMGLKDRDAYEVKRATTIPLAQGFAALALALGLLSLTWYREGR
jgi:hypothetical protein